MKTIAIFGYGYVARFLTKEFSKDHKVIIVTRQPERVPKDITAIHFGKTLPAIDGAISTVPPFHETDPVLETYKHLLNNWCAYCSSTSVYGSHEGAWVDEQSLCNPTNFRSQNRLKIEQKWSAQNNACILRLAGIYGPGRSILEQVIMNQAKRIDKQNHVFSRIHIQDIAGFSRFAFSKKLVGIYNLADELPASSRVVIEYVCDKLQKSYPPLVSFNQENMSPMTFEFYQDFKKVSTAKLIKHGYILQIKNYKEGMDDIITNYLSKEN